MRRNKAKNENNYLPVVVISSVVRSTVVVWVVVNITARKMKNNKRCNIYYNLKFSLVCGKIICNDKEICVASRHWYRC